MVRTVLFASALLVCVGCADTSVTQATPPLDQSSDEACAPIAFLGVPGTAPPSWCLELTSGPPTLQAAPNAWVDDFDHGLSFAEIGEGYRVFDHAPAFSATCSSGHFRHNNHWMADVGTDGCEGVMMRPDTSFRFVEGKLVVETTVAAGINAYGGAVWPEIVVTNAPQPTTPHAGGLYAYSMFEGYWAFGCRLESDRTPICALFDDAGDPSQTGGRVFEISFFQHEGAERVFGGGPFGAATDAAWRTCAQEDPDLQCRDTFRLELERDAVTLYVNGVRYMEHRGLPPGKQLPEALVAGDVYTYFASWSSRLNEVGPGARYHWDRIAINP